MLYWNQRVRTQLVNAVAIEKEALLLMQQGSWQKALDRIGAVLRGSHPDPSRLRLERAKCRMMQGAIEQADEELESLLKDDGLNSALRRDVLVWRGSLLSGRDSETALKLITEAGSLEPNQEVAEGEFLLGLMAEDTTSAIEHFSATVSRKPHHIGARRMLAGCLFLSGRPQEALEHAQICSEATDRDASIHLLTTLCQIAASDQQHHQRNASGHEDPEANELLTAYGNLLSTFRKTLQWPLPPNEIRALFQNATIMHDAIRNAGECFPAPPGIHLQCQLRWKQLLTDYSNENDQGILDSLQSLADALHEGTLYRFSGQLHAIDGHWTQAEAAWLEAKKRVSLVTDPQLFLFFLARVKWQLNYQDADQAALLQSQAVEYLRELMASERKPALSRIDLYDLSEMAVQVREYALALDVTEEWQRQHPEDPNAYEMYGIVQSKQANYCSAISYYLKAKKMGSREPNLDTYLNEARELLLQQAEQIKAESKPN